MPRGMFMSLSWSIHTTLISLRLSCLYSPSNIMVIWKLSVSLVSRDIFSYLDSCVRCRCWPGRSEGYKIYLVLGKARRMDRNYWTSVGGVPMARNSSSVRDSFKVLLPRSMRRSSCIWKPSQMWLSISMPSVDVPLDFVWEVGVWCLLETWGVDVAV